ncbi:MAG: AAA family ATPase [Saprospiraceae bacterium]|nr:AAA family ATPase [Saprospiraceae bacterium]MDW8230888.1 AAA family ATPase [Saprospiraceae bacterium]
MYGRPLYGLLKSYSDEPRKFIYALIGPRQVGKTTLLSQLLEESTVPYHSVSADDVGANSSAWLPFSGIFRRSGCI